MASCMLSSAKSRRAGPRTRARWATTRPTWWRNRCSSRAPVCSLAPLPLETLASVPVTLRVQLAKFDGAVFEVRMIERAGDGFVVVLGLDQVDAAEHFLGFAVRAIGGPTFSVDAFKDPAKIGAEPLALYNIGPFAPGH